MPCRARPAGSRPRPSAWQSAFEAVQTSPDRFRKRPGDARRRPVYARIMAEAMSLQAGDEQIERPDGRVELREGVVLDDPALFNEDLAPTSVAKRTWSTYTFAALWISMAHCIPTYMLAAGLISAGMNWRQALATILIGNVIVLAPILANSHPGTKYGIPFPVFARASYGVFGANVPAIMRAVVA